MQSNQVWPNNQYGQTIITEPMMQGSQMAFQMQGNALGTSFGLNQIQQGNDTIVMIPEKQYVGHGNHRRTRYHPVPYKLVNGGNAGPVYVSLQNPRFAKDQQMRAGELCPECGKGILLINMECVRQNHPCRECLLYGPMVCCFCLPPISWPFVACFCCYLRYGKKRKCIVVIKHFQTVFLVKFSFYFH